MSSELLNNVGEKVNIWGGNLEEGERTLCLASSFFAQMEPKPTDEEIELMQKMENWWIKQCSSEHLSEIEQLKIEDDKVVIPENTTYHNLMHPTVEMIKSISKYGILCSENFGSLEDAGEGRFCAFISKTISEPTKAQYQRMRRWGINFYFDTTNPIRQKLMSLDYFEYEKKKQNGETLEEYPDVVKTFFDSIIEPLSPSGKGHHMYEDKTSIEYSWLAIPFGFPPELINGIKIYAPDKLDCSLDELSKMFPNATIFDKDKNIIKRPYLEKEKLKKEGEEEMKVIYRIHSESAKVGNYIDYDPSKSYWVTPKRHDNRRKLGVKTNQELFEESKCAISKLKNEKSFTETPKDTKIIEVVIPKGQKRATLATSESTSADFDLYLDLKIVPQIRISEGKVVGYKIVAEDGGMGKARQSEDANTIIRERRLSEEKMRKAYALNKAISNTGSELIEQQHKLLSENPLKKEAELVMER